MDTDKCTALLRTLECGSLSAAAEELGYTPSGISRMMASLENELGFPLLIRSREGIQPTKECLHILPSIRELSEDSLRMMHEADSLKGIESGELIVGTPYPAYFRRLSSLVREFCQRYPGIHVDIIDGISSHYSELVEQSRADFCIISSRSRDISWRPLTVDPMVALVSESHPLASRSSVTREDLESEPFIEMYPRIETDQHRYLEETGIKPDIRYSSSNILAAYYMVESGLGITVDNYINVSDFSGGVKPLPLEEPYDVQIGIATPRENKLSPAARKFIEMSLKFFPE